MGFGIVLYFGGFEIFLILFCKKISMFMNIWYIKRYFFRYKLIYDDIKCECCFYFRVFIFR